MQLQAVSFVSFPLSKQGAVQPTLAQTRVHERDGTHSHRQTDRQTDRQADTHPTVALLANLQRAIPTDGVLCLCEAKTAGAAPGVDALQTEIDTDRQTETDRQRQTGTDTQT